MRTRKNTPRRETRGTLLAGVLVAGLTVFGQTHPGATAYAQGDRGFSVKVPPLATGEEVGRQSSLWVLSVELKPLRLIEVELTDPKTGEKRKEFVWYLVYRANNLPIRRPELNLASVPENYAEPPLGPQMFVPEFTLVGTDNERVEIYHDVVLPEALVAIEARERMTLKNSVSVVGPLPPVADADPTSPAEPIVGVAMWRGVNPETDYFTLYMEGFSNGYRVSEGPDGMQIVQRRTLVSKFWRPGDAFDLSETEFRHEEAPEWIYRADEVAETAADPSANNGADPSAGNKDNPEPAKPKPADPGDGDPAKPQG